jgi:DNA-binding PadR family transcriptional regulator
MSTQPIRITIAVAEVLRAFLDDPAQPRYGYDLMQATGQGSGKLYPILARLQAAGWLEKCREDIDPGVEGRPVRYWYRLTTDGVEAGRRELADVVARLGRTS